KWIQIEASDDQAAAVDRGNLRVQDRLGPLVNGNSRLEKAMVESPCGCTGKWKVAPTGEQQPNVYTTPSRGDDRSCDSSVRQEVSMGDVDALARIRKRLDVAPAQTSTPAEA